MWRADGCDEMDEGIGMGGGVASSNERIKRLVS